MKELFITINYWNFFMNYNWEKHLELELNEMGEISNQKTGLKSVLETLEVLWDETQYNEEYDLQNFLKNMNKS